MPPAPPAPPPAPLQGPSSYPQWQPPRRRSGAGAVIGGIFGAIAVAFVGIIVVAAVLRGGDDSHMVSPVALPTSTPYEARTSEPADPTPTASTTSAADASGDSQDSDTTTDTTNTTDTTDTADTRPRKVLNTSLTNNTLYRAGSLPRVSCPAGSADIYSNAQLKALILKTSRCLDKGWAQIMRQQGIDWRRPGYAITSTKGRGACGDFPSAGGIVPYYCPRNETIYASTSAMVRGSGRSLGYGQLTNWHGGIVSMMAHEYGHHVQQLSGLSNTWWEKSLRSTSRSGKLALSRRFELQATCFGAMFMRSVSATYPVTPARRDTLYYFYSRVGDWAGAPRDHGSPANNNRWFRQGYEKNKTFQCNTWLAPASTTS
ncbi:neutral zinc metallopeptidase [Streptosporangium sandarakinum]|uniref:neutral zinc metallopeptidase n=1 Tax=Streptosporangium sandarakinum TaxID=1260955 RepID=UPI0036ACD28D